MRLYGVVLSDSHNCLVTSVQLSVCGYGYKSQLSIWLTLQIFSFASSSP